MKFKKLMLLSTLFIPTSFLVSCSLTSRSIVEEPPHEYHEVKYIVPKEMYPGVVNDPEEYDKLKNTPWKVWGPIKISEPGPKSYFATNGYITFEFEEDYVKFIKDHGYSIESFSKKIFEPLSLSPDIELFTWEAQVKFIYKENASDMKALGLTWDYRHQINIFGTNDRTIFPEYFDFLGSTLLKEYSQVCGRGAMPKSIPLSPFPKNVTKLWNEMLNELPSEHYLKVFKDKIGETYPWTAKPTNIPSDFDSWSKKQNPSANNILKIYNSHEVYNENFHGSEGRNEGNVVELVGRMFKIYAGSLIRNAMSYYQTLTDLMLLSVTYDAPVHVLNYNFFDRNDLLQSFHIMKAIYHSWYNLANKNGLRIDFGGEDRIRFTSFGAQYTKNMKILRIIDKTTNATLLDRKDNKLEFKIQHKRYPLGFNRNPFTPYEYKYVADGAYVNVGNMKFKMSDEQYKNVGFEIIDDKGNKIPNTDTTFQINSRDKWPKFWLFWNVKNNVWEEVEE